MKGAIKKIIILDFLCANDMLLAVETLYKTLQFKNFNSSLYYFENKYRLIAFCHPKKVPAVFRNFKKVDKPLLEFAKTIEYGQLISKNAIKKIGVWLI